MLAILHPPNCWPAGPPACTRTLTRTHAHGNHTTQLSTVAVAASCIGPSLVTRPRVPKRTAIATRISPEPMDPSWCCAPASFMGKSPLAKLTKSRCKYLGLGHCIPVFQCSNVPLFQCFRSEKASSEELDGCTASNHLFHYLDWYCGSTATAAWTVSGQFGHCSIVKLSAQNGRAVNDSDKR